MIQAIKIENILFLDIETVPAYSNFNEMPDKIREFWESKSSYFRKDNESAEDIYNRTGIYAEFGKIICISVGFIFHKNGEKFFRVKSFSGDNEKILLSEFSSMLIKRESGNKELLLCGHNGKEFDFPYIARRMLINNVKLPNMLSVAGKKPWEVNFLDTLELWKFGDYKNYTSLGLLAELFNIPSPKNDIDGSMVADVYWKEKDLSRIVEYCEKDTLTVAQLFLKYRGQEIVPENNIERADDNPSS